MQIGRTKSSAVYIKDPAVSQKHARLEWTGSKYTITDLGSSNGTTVNEKEIREGEPRAIRNGDVVVVGTDTVVKVSVDAATGAEAAEAPAKQPRGAAARAAAAAKREAAAAKREEAAAKAARTREAKRAAAKAKAEAEAEAEAKTKTERDPSRSDESITVEAFLTETAERLISQIRDLAEAEVAALKTETDAVKAELRAECAAAA